MMRACHRHDGSASRLPWAACRLRARRWPEEAAVACPSLQILEELLSTAYHASLLREEERPVSCRVLFVDPESLPPADGPPTGLHRLVDHSSDRPRPFTDHEETPSAACLRLRNIRARSSASGAFRAKKWRSGASFNPGPAGCSKPSAVGPARRRCRAFRSFASQDPDASRSLVALRRSPNSRGGRLTDVSMDVFSSSWLGIALHGGAPGTHGASRGSRAGLPAPDGRGSNTVCSDSFRSRCSSD